MSYAFPEVQDRVIDYLLFLLQTGCDGVSLFFHRCFPYVMYEQPAIERFQAEYGLDPRTLPEDDERWLACRAKIMTGFIRKVRNALEEYGKTHGIERPRLAAWLAVNLKSNKTEALDGRAWAVEGLVDELVADTYENESDLPGYIEMTKGTTTKMYINTMPRQMEPAEYREKALEAYEGGADGLALWDSYIRHITPYRWTMAIRLGHKDELRSWDDGQGEYFRKVYVLRMAGKRVDRYWASLGL